MARIQNCRLRKRQHLFVDAGGNTVEECVICRAPRPKPSTLARLSFLADYWRDMGRLWRSIAVEMARPIAREVLHMHLDRDETYPISAFDSKLKDLFALAMVDHKLKHPRARGERLWMFTAPNGRGLASVACRFCGRILIPSARVGGSYSSTTSEHVAWCALSALATGGSAEPITRKPLNTEGVTP